MRGRLGPFEAVWFLTAVIYMTMIIVTRVVPGPVSAAAARYGYLIAWLLVPAVVPHLRLSRSAKLRWITVGLGVLIVAGNVVQLRNGLAYRESLTSEVRGRVHAVGALIAAGEPAVEASPLFPDRTRGPKSFTVASVSQLLRSKGWAPDPEEVAAFEQTAQRPDADGDHPRVSGALVPADHER